MRTHIFIIFFAILLTKTSIGVCSSKEDMAKAFIDNFYKDVDTKGADKFGGSLKKSRASFNYSYFSADLKKLIQNNFLETPDIGSYKLTSESKSGTEMIITSIGTRSGKIGNQVNVYNQFLVSKLNNEWKITDTYSVIDFYLNFKIKSEKWDESWDINKSYILNGLMNNLKLEVISKGASPNYNEKGRKGRLKLINNSNFDVEDIEYFTEHFDSNGVSVNSYNDFITGIIRSKAYKEFDWSSYDCASCNTQKFKILFFKEK